MFKSETRMHFSILIVALMVAQLVRCQSLDQKSDAEEPDEKLMIVSSSSSDGLAKQASLDTDSFVEPILLGKRAPRISAGSDMISEIMPFGKRSRSDMISGISPFGKRTPNDMISGISPFGKRTNSDIISGISPFGKRTPHDMISGISPFGKRVGSDIISGISPFGKREPAYPWTKDLVYPYPIYPVNGKKAARFSDASSDFSSGMMSSGSRLNQPSMINPYSHYINMRPLYYRLYSSPRVVESRWPAMDSLAATQSFDSNQSEF